jgi:hypothetical protein
MRGQAAAVVLVGTGCRCSGGAAAIGIPSCSPSDNAASSLAIIALMRSHSFNTDANLPISSSVMASAPRPLRYQAESLGASISRTRRPSRWPR